MKMPLPDWLCSLLAACPTHGEGVHNWLFRCARQMHAHFGPTQIVEILTTMSRDCGRAVPRREVEAAVRDAANCAWTASGQKLQECEGAQTAQIQQSRPEAKWP